MKRALEAAMVLGAVVAISGVVIWAVYTRRQRLWLIVALTAIGVISAEVFALAAYVVLLDPASEASLVAIGFGALSIASFVGVAKQPVRVR